MKLVERGMESFLKELASESPAPGGGSAAALGGAMAAALCCMACRLTLARKRFEVAWPEMRECLARAESLGARLRELVDEDSAAYNGVVAARRLPSENASGRQERENAIQEAVVRAARVPLETLETVARLTAVLERVVPRTNPACITDAGSAAALTRAAALSAAYNVRINLPDIADKALARGLAESARAASAAVEEAARGIACAVDAAMEEGSAS